MREALEAREGRALPENTVAVGEYAWDFQGEAFPAHLAFTALLRHLAQEPREVSLGFPLPVTPRLLRSVLEGEAHLAVLGLLRA